MSNCHSSLNARQIVLATLILLISSLGWAHAYTTNAATNANENYFVLAADDFALGEKMGNHPGGLLWREIARQSLLLTARESMGLITRDEQIGEFDGLPDDLRERAWHLRVDADGQTGWSVRIWRPIDGQDQDLLTFKPKLPGLRTHKIFLTSMEAAGRLDLLELMKDQYPLRPIPAAHPVQPAMLDEASFESYLNTMSFLAQMQVARSAHERLRVNPQSSAAMSALIRAYAHMGHLSLENLDCSNKSYFARSLVYAQRLVTSAPANPEAYWLRGYAWAFAGFFQNAQEDFQKAHTLCEALDEEIRPAVPSWLDIVTSFLIHDDMALKTFADLDGPHTEIALYLRTCTLVYLNADILTFEAGLESLDRSPECFRVADFLYSASGVRAGHTFSTAPFEVVSAMLSEQVSKAVSLPLPAKTATRRANLNRSVKSVADAIKSLVACSDPAIDPAELSWGAYGNYIRESMFKFVHNRLYFLVTKYSVDVDDELDDLMTLSSGHRLTPLLRMFHTQVTRRQTEVRKLYEGVDVRNLSQIAIRLLHSFNTRMTSPRLADDALYLTRSHRDANCNDLSEWIYSKRDNDFNLRLKANSLNRPCGECPLQPMTRIRYAPENDRDLDELEQTARRHWAVAGAMGEFHHKNGHYQKAIEFSKIHLERVRDPSTLFRIADCHLKLRDEKAGIKAMLAMLNEPDLGLQHSRSLRTLANYFIARGEFAIARPFAEEAAQSWSGDSIFTHFWCLERLQVWRESELWARRMSERYNNHYWLYWCLRTDRGNRDEALRFALQHEDDLLARSDKAKFLTMVNKSQLLLMSGREQESLQLIESFAEECIVPGFLLHAAVIYGRTGDVQARDQLIQKAAGIFPSSVKIVDENRAHYTELAWKLVAQGTSRNDAYRDSDIAVEMQRILALEPGAQPDLTRVDRLRARVDPSYVPTLTYFIGHALESSGNAELAKSLYIPVIESKLVGLFGYTQTWLSARRLGFDPYTILEAAETRERLGAPIRTQLDWIEFDLPKFDIDEELPEMMNDIEDV